MSSLLTVAMVSRVEVFHHTDSSWSRLFSAVMEVKAAGVRCSRLPARVLLYLTVECPQLTVQMKTPQARTASQQPGQPAVSAVPAQAELLQQGVGLPVRTPGSDHHH